MGAARRLEGALALSALFHVLLAASWLRAPPASARPLLPPPLSSSAAPLAGATFDLGAGEALDDHARSEPAFAPAPPRTRASSPSRELAVGGPAPPPVPASGASGPRLTSASGEPSASSGPSLYGAVGERSAVDLVPAFQRAFAQTASADPTWQSAALGTGGHASLAIVLDESGHITSSTLGAGASAALRSSVQRTVALLAHRPFIARGARTTLHLSAQVTADTVHDGLHGDRFALGVGETAWFALPSGRRIDLQVSAAR